MPTIVICPRPGRGGDPAENDDEGDDREGEGDDARSAEADGDGTRRERSR